MVGIWCFSEKIIVILSKVRIKTNLVYIDIDTLLTILSEKCRFNICILSKKTPTSKSALCQALISLMKMEKNIFQIDTWPPVCHMIKEPCGFNVETSFGKAAPCVISCPWADCKGGYNVINLSRELTRPPHWEIMLIFSWELLVECHHPDKSGDHWPSASGDIKYLTFHVTLQKHVVQGSYTFMSGSSSFYITTVPSLVVIGIVIVEIQGF